MINYSPNMKNLLKILILLITAIIFLWLYANYKFPELVTAEVGTQKGTVEGTDNFEFEYPVFDGWHVDYIDGDMIAYKPSVLYKMVHPLVNKVEIKIYFVDYEIEPDLSEYSVNQFGIYYIKDMWAIEFYDNGGGIMFEQTVSTINPVFNLDAISKTFKKLDI